MESDKLLTADWLQYFGVRTVGNGFHSGFGQLVKAANSVKCGIMPEKTVARATSTSLETCQQMTDDGLKFLVREKYGDALICCTTAIARCPPNRNQDLAIFHYNRALAYQKLMDKRNAFEDCNRAIHLHSNCSKALRMRAELSMELKMFKTAFQDYMKLFALQNNETDDAMLRLAFNSIENFAHERTDEIFAERGDSILPLSKTCVDEFLNSFVADPILCDKSLLAVSVSTHDDNDVSGYEKVKFLMRNKEYDGIVDACNQIVDENRDSADLLNALVLRGTFYILLGLPHKAKSDIEKVMVTLDNKNDLSILQSYPKGTENLLVDVNNSLKCNCLIKLAIIEKQQNNFEEAKRLLTEALRLDDKNSDAHARMAEYEMQIWKIEEAIKSFDKALESNPTSIRLLLLKVACIFINGVILHSEELVTNACSEMKALQYRFPDSAEIRLAFAQMCADMLNGELAIKYAEEAFKLSPTNASVCLLLGVLYIQHGDEDAGLKSINQAFIFDRLYAPVYKVFATYYSKRKDLAKMFHYYDEAQKTIRIKQEMNECICLREINAAEINLQHHF